MSPHIPGWLPLSQDQLCHLQNPVHKGNAGRALCIKLLRDCKVVTAAHCTESATFCGCAGPRVMLPLALFSEGRTEREPLPCAGYSLCYATDITQNVESSFRALAFPCFPSRLRQWKNFMWQTQSLPSISSNIWQIQAPTPRISSSVPGASPSPWPWSTWAPGAILQTR